MKRFPGDDDINGGPIKGNRLSPPFENGNSG